MSVPDHLDRQPLGLRNTLHHALQNLLSDLKVTISMRVGVEGGVSVFSFLPEPLETASCKRPYQAASEMPCAIYGHTTLNAPCPQGRPRRWHGHPETCTQEILGALPLLVGRFIQCLTSDLFRVKKQQARGP